MRRRKPHVDSERMDLLEEASSFFAFAMRHASLVAHPSYFGAPWHRSWYEEEGMGDTSKWEAHQRELLDVIRANLTEDEIALALAIAKGDAEAPYPYRSLGDGPHRLHDIAFPPDEGDGVVSLEERRRKRASDATR
jgi:hypothetical protein